MPELLLTRNKDFVYHDCDNPFRPEGELAKEAEEFVQQLKEQKEQEVAEIINTKTSSSNINPDASVDEKTIGETVPALVQSPSKVSNGRKSSDQADNVVVVNTPKTTAEAPAETSTTNAETPETPATNVKPKKTKTKAKCGCSIS